MVVPRGIGRLVFIGTVGGGNRLHRPPGTVANGKVYALDSRTGRIVWEFEAIGNVFSSPAVWGGLVFIATTDGYLYALDARDGRIAWEQEDDSYIISSPAVWVPGSLEWPMFRGNPQRTGTGMAI